MSEIAFDDFDIALHAVVDVFNYFRFSIFFVGDNGISAANHSAKNLIRNNPEFRIFAGRIAITNPKDQVRLNGAILESRNKHRGTALTLGQHGHADQLYLMLQPFKAPPYHTILFACGAAETGEVEPKLLAQWLNLTPKQSEIAAMIGQGWSIEEIAVPLNVSPGTVRTHIKHIFMKTGCTSQTQLMTLVRTAPLNLTKSTQP